MTAAQRALLERMFSMLMGAELEVHQAYVRWTGSLRRVLTRATHGRHARVLTLSSMALEAGAAWVAADPVSRGRELPEDILGVGALEIEDVSQLQMWRDIGPQEVRVSVAGATGQLPERERAALRLAAGTSHKVVAGRINDLVAAHGRSSCPHLQIPGRARPDHQVRPANADSLQRRTRCPGSPDQ